MDVYDVPRCLGEEHLTRDQLPPALRALVDEALALGLVFEDCRERLACL